jgi:hypothetical protein
MQMRMLIAVMVFAKNSKGAVKAAHDVVNKKLGTKSQGGPFDWYVDFGKDDPLGLIHKKRWGPIPSVLQVNTARFPTEDKRGLKMVNSAMEKNRKAFQKSIAHIRYQIEHYTDDELFDEVEPKFDLLSERTILNPNPAWFRSYCANVCGYFPGLRAHLYDFQGHTISSPNRLQQMLNDTDSNPYYWDDSKGQDPNWGRHIWNQPLWVIPFDVHY